MKTMALKKTTCRLPKIIILKAIDDRWLASVAFRKYIDEEFILCLFMSIVVRNAKRILNIWCSEIWNQKDVHPVVARK